MQSIARLAPAVLFVAIVAATLTTAYIHYTLGGMLFLLNALGYLGLTAALVVVTLGFLRPLRPLVLLALGGYTVATIVGWAIMGPYFTLAYITKAVEVGLLVLIGIELFRTRADLVPALRFARTLVNDVVRIVLRRRAPASADSEA